MYKTLLISALLLSVTQAVSNSAASITFDFECGCLHGWRTTGVAFSFQPTLNDNPTARNRHQPSQHEGAYWIGSYENYTSYKGTPGNGGGDDKTGTMESIPFTLFSDRISFLIGGGCQPGVGLDLVYDGKVVRTARGDCNESMMRKSWDVSEYKGKIVQLRAVDSLTGGWGHINFDDIKFTRL